MYYLVFGVGMRFVISVVFLFFGFLVLVNDLFEGLWSYVVGFVWVLLFLYILIVFCGFVWIDGDWL